ncbi:1,4-dihydroxy-2-naphthoate polyprenyltransferase [Chloroflexia bacterium SDU3-3]|nr:1,4-dihydroxy-2-naphthoate polyprenyltransferase [Chloroflexia bacterium SDU3-3]
MTTTQPPAPSPARVWLMAARPATLPAAAAPVLVGTAAAAAVGSFRPLPALAALLGALLIQIGTNYANDYFDFKKGADTAERIGPTRATQSGLLRPETVRNGMIATFALAALVGLYLVAVGGWPILVVGVLSIAAGVLYTGGPWPLGYNGLGDVFSFVFFGLVAVCGTAYVQAGAVPPLAILASLPIAALVTAILVVNNLRDVATDRVAGKRTLAVIFGPGFARAEYAALVVAPYLLLPVIWLAGSATPWVLLPLLTAPLAVRLVRTMLSESGPTLNRALKGTGQLELLFGLLLALGLVL